MKTISSVSIGCQAGCLLAAELDAWMCIGVDGRPVTVQAVIHLWRGVIVVHLQLDI